FIYLHCIMPLCLGIIVLLYFQAEDGIRDRNVTGVQTCALPILVVAFQIVGEEADTTFQRHEFGTPGQGFLFQRCESVAGSLQVRSEERRVGRECSILWAKTGWNKQREDTGRKDMKIPYRTATQL